uniref:Cadherin domain-containing protein n=1 Tax=Megaselia scalaris TaxID=36166 RepID=T1GIG2_MEGSC
MPQLTSSALVVVNILDKNDNPPRFTRLFSVNVTENADIGSFVIRVTSSDLDIGENANATYSFTENPGEKFIIDSVSGNVTVAKYLDREQQDEYQLKVAAYDGSWRSETPLTITIQDQNDNYPEFEEPYYNFNMLENQRAVTFVGQVVASDKDKHGPNSAISYSLQHPSDLFTIDPTSGEIFSKRSMKYKYSQVILSPENMYSFKVIATDNGKPPLYSECLVNINIVNENLHAPKFEKPSYMVPIPSFAKMGQKIVQNEFAPEFTTQSYQVIVPENEPLYSVILTINATDRDSGPNGMIRYTLTDDNYRKDFAVDEMTGAVSIKEVLDYDSIQEYHLNITARDLGFNSKSTVAMLTVILTDINDNAPEFNQSKYDVYIAENQPANTFIYQVKATDKDSPKNAIIRYSIYGNTDLFYIDSITGEIRSGASFDYEMKNLYPLTVIAENPDSTMSSKTEVFVHITGVNEYYPQFHQPTFHFDISESAEVGTSVGLIYATDKDLGEDGKVYYLLVGSSNDKGFGIHRASGEIYVSRHLDRETQNRVVLAVLAKNAGSIHGNDTDEAQIIISIQDGNDPPEFITEIYQASISEAVSIGTKVYLLKLLTKIAQNNQFSYSIINGNVDKTFKIDPQTGQIETSRKLDRENISSYNLIIGAIDTGLPPQTGSATVNIEITDVNDNGPTFEENDKIGFVSENEPPGTVIMTLSASDPDLPPNAGPFTYNLVGGKHQQFVKVDSQTGVVRTTRSIDREQIPELEFIVEVEDNGRPRMSSRHLIKVNIIDQNDSPSSPRKVHVLVNSFNGKVPQGKIASVQPNDPDLIGDYHCRIISNPKSSPMGIFTIPTNCDLHTTSSSSTQDTYTYSVLGNDGIHDDVTSTATIGFQLFDNSTINNSITIYIKNMRPQDFLAFYFRRFIELLKEITEKGDEYIVYSLRDVDNRQVLK